LSQEKTGKIMIPFFPELRTVGWKGMSIDSGQGTMDSIGIWNARLVLWRRLRLDFGGDWPKLTDEA
jgi:hypothetical protein